jgi:hypothetical protein
MGFLTRTGNVMSVAMTAVSAGGAVDIDTRVGEID